MRSAENYILFIDESGKSSLGDQRIKKTSGGVDTFYVNKYFEKQGATTTAYIWAGDELAAIVTGNGVSTSTEYVHGDHLGSTNVTTNEDGEVSSLRDYYPYGKERISSGELSRTFLSQVGDAETDLQYLRARYLSPERGQFNSQDPVHLVMGNSNQIFALTGASQQQLLFDPQSLNSYAYGRGNPLRFSDPTGRFWWEGFYDWRGYNGVEGVIMKAGEVFGGHVRAMNAIQQNQGTVNFYTSQYGVVPALANAIIYEEQSHLTPDEALGREYLFPNVGSGGVGVMQVTAGVGAEYDYTKKELAQDSRKNVNAGVGNIVKEQARGGDVALTASRYNYSPTNNVTAYGERVSAQASNPNYNRNVIISGLQSIVSSLQKLVSSLKKGL